MEPLKIDALESYTNTSRYRHKSVFLFTSDQRILGEDDAYWFYYLKAGSAEIHANRQVYHVNGERIIMIAPSSTMEVILGENAGGLAVRIRRSKLFHSTWRETACLTAAEGRELMTILFHPGSRKYQEGLLGILNDDYRQYSPYQAGEVQQRVTEFVQQMLAERFARLPRIKRQRLGTRVAILQCVDDARRIIDETLHKPLDLNTLSRQALMSKYALIRNFKDVFGMAPYQYYISKRVEYGKTLLYGGATVKEAALRCGYSDIFSFSKQFKLLEGFPPSRLRMAC